MPPRPVAIVTGASAGLGLTIAKTFLHAGYDVVGVARDSHRLTSAADSIHAAGGSPEAGRFVSMAADVSVGESVEQLFAKIALEFGRVDVLINCVGQSDRGTIMTLTKNRLNELFRTNVVSALLCSQAALPLLQESHGVIVNIGSLGAKVGARHLGGYPAVKHALAGMTQQMRLEWRELGVHVALVSPGPIRRSDSGTRYDAKSIDTALPDNAWQPGGGTSVRGLDPQWVANQILIVVKRRTPDLVLPRYVRLLIAIGHLIPRLGDRLLLWMTKG